MFKLSEDDLRRLRKFIQNPERDCIGPGSHASCSSRICIIQKIVEDNRIQLCGTEAHPRIKRAKYARILLDIHTKLSK
jgi:hypothetical protein